jgi:sulfate/thiosulfate transport system permease protein
MAGVTNKKRRSILPGFGLTMGYTTLYLSLIVVIPLVGLFIKSSTMSWTEVGKALSDPNLVASLKLTFGLSLAAGLLNVVFGFVTAWTLVRYRFPGHKAVDAIIDLPFALPTAVSGITLATLYSKNGWLGKPWQWAAEQGNAALGWLHLPAFLPEQVAYTRLGILVALVFIGVPFMVRTLQPALEDMDPEVEEAAASLGATRRQAFWKVVLPALMPAVATGFALSLARAVGEYGSVIFISNNIPGKTQITAHLIMRKVENYDYAGATTLGVVMLMISFLMLAAINGLQWRASRRIQAGVS